MSPEFKRDVNNKTVSWLVQKLADTVIQCHTMWYPHLCHINTSQTKTCSPKYPQHIKTLSWISCASVSHVCIYIYMIKKHPPPLPPPPQNARLDLAACPSLWATNALGVVAMQDIQLLWGIAKKRSGDGPRQLEMPHISHHWEVGKIIDSKVPGPLGDMLMFLEGFFPYHDMYYIYIYI